MRVYVISMRGETLMPTTPCKAKKLLKDGKAKVVSKIPFVIKLLIPTGETKQHTIGGMDTGSKTIGCAAITNGKVVYQSEIQIRQDVSKKMQRRKMYRRARRGRKCRYRAARWLNRANSKKENRLAPSIKSKVDSHLREKNFIESILPISEWIVETASFDIQKINKPDIRKWEYQNGQQKGFYNIKAYVLHRDDYQCQKCRAKNIKLHVHHILFSNKGGTNTPSNLITLCKTCHDKLHKGKFTIKGNKSKTKHATEIGIVKSQLLKSDWNFGETFGYETKFKREQILKLPKTHYNDAIVICLTEGELVKQSDTIYYKKHVAHGDYQQTKGKRSEKKIPTSKLFGLRKFDLIKTIKGIGFVKGKRSTGFFVISDLNGNIISPSVNVKKNCNRLTARTTTLIQMI